MWNKQRYCRQFQNHVWIQNFHRSNWKITMLWEFPYFFIVSRYGKSCKELCAAILWVSKQDDSTTLQSICSLHRWPSLLRRNEICWRIVTSMLSICSRMFVLGRPNIRWSVNKSARSIVNINSIAMWVTLQINAAWDLEDSEMHFWSNIVHFWNSYICSYKLDV